MVCSCSYDTKKNSISCLRSTSALPSGPRQAGRAALLHLYPFSIYIVFKLPPYFNNFSKRVVKAQKYYFIDVGLLTYLLGIESPQQVVRDPLIGQLFENLVIAECLKAQANLGKRTNLSDQLKHAYLAYNGDNFEFSESITALHYDQLVNIFA